jgi:Putative peptidoglycan binding domain
MNRTLRYGSTGDDVTKLQNGLNLLPSSLAALKTDGVYGSKTTARVREFQGANSLVPDGVAGPLTWEKFVELLAQVQQGGMPSVPGLSSPSSTAVDLLRPVILIIAQQHFGLVDFQQLVGGRPKGIDFLIHMFQVAAGATLTDQNFIDPNTLAWTQQPWIGNPGEQRKSWCGIFCVYCYKKAGLDASWNLGNGRPSGPIQLNTWSPSFATNIRPADIGCVASQNHHFLIEEVGGGMAPSMTTIDGNQDYGRILRVWSSDAKAHRVGKDNFNYYSLG